jgi:transposase InsO family protein
LIVEFIDQMRTEGHAVESICRVLCEQGCQVAARSYRHWSRPGQIVAERTITDAIVLNKVRDLAWTLDEHGCRRLSPEGLYGRRKMTALVRRTLPTASPGSVDRAMKSLDLQGIRRAKGIRTTIRSKDGTRAGDLLDRDFTAPAPNRTWVMDFTYVRTWTGFVYVAFILDVFAQKILAWHATTRKDVELAMTPLQMAIWQRDREGHPIEHGQLIGHSDAGSQGGFNWSSQHLVILGVLDGTTSAAGGSGASSGDAFTGATDPGQGCGAGVLAANRGGYAQRGCRTGGWRVGAGGDAVVSARWRYAAIESGRAVRSILVVRRTRRAGPTQSERAGGPGDWA